MTEERTEQADVTEMQQAIADTAEDSPRQVLEINIEPYDGEDDSEFSTIEDIKEHYPKFFVATGELRGKPVKFKCERVHPFDIFGEETYNIPESQELTIAEVYNDSKAIVLAVVRLPKFKEEDFKELPMGFTQKLSRDIMREISPQFTDSRLERALKTLRQAVNPDSDETE